MLNKETRNGFETNSLRFLVSFFRSTAPPPYQKIVSDCPVQRNPFFTRAAIFAKIYISVSFDGSYIQGDGLCLRMDEKQ